MSKQIRPSVTNPSIGQIYNEVADGLLKLDPDFQRRFVWTQAHQEQFLDTILNGYPFPEIYVSKGKVDVAAMRTVRHVIDGQQRLTTVKNYIDGKFERPLSLVPSYQTLNDAQKEEFLSYEVVVRDLGKIDEATVREVFRRINLTKFKLDDIEIQNAIYDGEFIQTAKKIIDSTNLSLFGVFKDTEFSRMADLHFILLVMSTVELGGYFAQDKEVETSVEKFNEHYPNKQNVTTSILGALDTIEGLNLPDDSMWFRKSNFFTLVSELALNTDNIVDNLKARLTELEQGVMSHKLKPDTSFGMYYSYMYQSTNGRKARVVRSQMFREYCTKIKHSL